MAARIARDEGRDTGDVLDLDLDERFRDGLGREHQLARERRGVKVFSSESWSKLDAPSTGDKGLFVLEVGWA